MAITTTQATSYGHQKKIITRISGEIWMVVSDTGSNAKFMYSQDNGVTWIDSGSDLAGWANGSIGYYVDSGGVERMVAVWKQSGTGGGRTDAHIYIAVGDWIGGGWGTPVDFGIGYAGWLYPDLVCHAEGAGGMAHIVISFADSTPRNMTSHERWSISGDVPTFASSTYISPASPGYSINTNTFPSIDIDPVNKHLYAAWSAGGNGAGKGLRFRKASYSAGTWTWGTEQEIDNTIYALGPSQAPCLRYYANGAEAYIHTVSWYNAGSVYKDMLYRRDAADTTTTTHTLDANVSSSGKGLWFGSMTIVPWTGDAYIFGSTFNDSFVYYGIWTRTGTSYSGVILSDEVANSASPQVPSTFSFGYVRWIYTSGNNSPYQVKYDQIFITTLQTIVPDGTITNTWWTDQTGGTTNIWQAVDETTTDDTDYIKVTL